MDHDISTHERNWLLTEKYNGNESPAFLDDLARLKHGEPLAYIIGYTPFLEARIYLDSQPMIPRVETEYWITMALKDMVNKAPQGARVLDLCAGSGCIGVAALMSLSDITVDFVEKDVRHHDTIKRNLFENNIDATRARILGGDLFSQVDAKYDYILTNPPYINPALSDRMDDSVRVHEPNSALFGGKDGLSLIHRIIADAYTYLMPYGHLYIEHEPEQTKAVHTAAREQGYHGITAFRDQYDVERLTHMDRRA